MKRKTLLLSLLFALLFFTLVPVVSSAEETLPEESLETAPETDVDADENLFALLFEKIGDSLGEIFAGTSAIASLLIVFTYKKGFLPLLSGAFDRLAGTVKNVEEDAKAGTEAAKKLANGLQDRLAGAEKTIEKLSALLADYAEKLPSVEAQKGESAVFRTVMLGQIDLLENVFMASSLPQYRKDEIGERVAEMKAAVNAEDAADGEKKD